MTLRRGVTIKLNIDAPHPPPLNLKEYEEQSLKDVRTYIENRISRSFQLRQQIQQRGETEAEFIDLIAEKSESNFMYLRYVLDDIENGWYEDLSLEKFPTGLQQYYQFHWQRMGMMDDPLPEIKINVLYHLAVSRLPVAESLIMDYVMEQSVTKKSIVEVVRDVQEVLKEWAQFLHRQLIEKEICYRVYHASFRDFLYRTDMIQSMKEVIDSIENLSRIQAKVGMRDMGLEEIANEEDKNENVEIEEEEDGYILPGEERISNDRSETSAIETSNSLSRSIKKYWMLILVSLFILGIIISVVLYLIRK